MCGCGLTGVTKEVDDEVMVGESSSTASNVSKFHGESGGESGDDIGDSSHDDGDSESFNNSTAASGAETFDNVVITYARH